MTQQEQAIISLNDRLTQLELKASIELNAVKERLKNVEQAHRQLAQDLIDALNGIIKLVK
jgi:hypothetical protein